MTNRLMIIHHYTKFGKKWLSSSGDTEWTPSNTKRKYHQDKHSLTFWTFAVTLALNAIIKFFSRTLWLMMLYYQTKFSCKQTSSLEDIVKIVILWSYKPLLWPWHWTQWTNFPAWHSGLWCCMTIPGSVTKCSVVQKISSRQSVTNILNLGCDLDLECSNPIFPQDTGLWCCTIKPSWVANGPAV